MSSTTSPTPVPAVDRDPARNRLSIGLAGALGPAEVVATMARARHAAERCEPGFGVVVDVREFVPSGPSLAALSEWEDLLRRAGAGHVVRVGEGEALADAAVTARTAEAAVELLEE